MVFTEDDSWHWEGAGLGCLPDNHDGQGLLLKRPFQLAVNFWVLEIADWEVVSISAYPQRTELTLLIHLHPNLGRTPDVEMPRETR